MGPAGPAAQKKWGTHSHAAAMAKKAAKLAAEAEAHLAAESRRSDMRAEKEEHKAAEAARMLADEDPSLALCSTRDLSEELAQCFDAHGTLLPRAKHPLQLRRERDAFIALGIFTGSLVAQHAKVDELLCDVWRMQAWVENNSVALEGELGCRELKPLGKWEALPESWQRGSMGPEGEVKVGYNRNPPASKVRISAVPLLINALKHICTSRSHSGNVSMYHAAHRCRVASCVAAHAVLRDGGGQRMADGGCAGAADGEVDRCMHSVLLDAAGEPTFDPSLRCLAPGASIHFDGEGRAALATEWAGKGSKAEQQTKKDVGALIAQYAVAVTRKIPAPFCGDILPFDEGDTCVCLEFGEDMGKLNGETVRLVDGYPAANITVKGMRTMRYFVNLAFMGHPMHGTGATGFVAVHRCHNPAVRTPTPLPLLAPRAPRMHAHL